MVPSLHLQAAKLSQQSAEMEAVSSFTLGKGGRKRERLPNSTQETGSLVRKRPRELPGASAGDPGGRAAPGEGSEQGVSLCAAVGPEEPARLTCRANQGTQEATCRETAMSRRASTTAQETQAERGRPA